MDEAVGAAINVEARAVSTLAWMSRQDTAFAVPVFQRHYRWDLEACDRLLADIRAVANADVPASHFIGSILASESHDGGVTELVLIDGQQRLVTASLLAAALHRSMSATGDGPPDQLARVLEHPAEAGRPRLRPHSDRGSVFEEIVLTRPDPESLPPDSRFAQNYAHFLAAVADDASTVREGLDRLEHVVVTLTKSANPQQIFESLNSTGAPLRNDELIHNYVLMGLTHEQQIMIEEEFWIPIEEDTKGAVEPFLRDYLVLTIGRDDRFTGEHGVYDVFKTVFPTLPFDDLVEEHGPAWREYAEVFQLLVDPDRAGDDEIARQLVWLNTFGRATYPLLLDVYRAHRNGEAGVSRGVLLEILELLQSLLIRRMVVGQGRSGVIARLCRTWVRSRDTDLLTADIVRRTPSDERVRSALRLGRLRHAGYVLGRIDGLDELAGLEIEHIFPQGPSAAWSGSQGGAPWGALDDEDQARHHELLDTIGNLTLLEQPLNAGASNKSFQDKKHYFRDSAVPETRALASVESWGIEAIEQRTARLTESFLDIWSRPAVSPSAAEEGLRPLLDVPERSGYYDGWKTEFDYVSYHGEIWEVRNVKQLAERVFKRLWTSHRDEVLAWNDANDGPIDDTLKNPQNEPLDDSHFLYMAWFPRWLLWATKGVLDELDLVDGVFVKYSSTDSDVDELDTHDT